MANMINQQHPYIITGINRLTQEREALTPPITLRTARELMAWQQRHRQRGRCIFAYTKLKIERQFKQLELWN